MINKVIHLDTLKITDINAEGPNKTATGGMNNDTLIKYGKTFTLEMTDAMGRYDVLDALYGANLSDNKGILAISDRFAGEMTIVGKTFVIDQATGIKQPVRIIIPVFLCDSIFNLTQDAEGDISTFSLNGSILRFESDSIGSVVDGKYTSGSDNLFYFFATEDAYRSVKEEGYRETEAKKELGTGNVASLDKMLEKFGVVTVMDVDIYPCKRFTEAQEADEAASKQAYEIGEWDAKSTFNQFTDMKSGYTAKVEDSKLTIITYGKGYEGYKIQYSITTASGAAAFQEYSSPVGSIGEYTHIAVRFYNADKTEAKLYKNYTKAEIEAGVKNPTYLDTSSDDK